MADSSSDGSSDGDGGPLVVETRRSHVQKMRSSARARDARVAQVSQLSDEEEAANWKVERHTRSQWRRKKRAKDDEDENMDDAAVGDDDGDDDEVVSHEGEGDEEQDSERSGGGDRKKPSSSSRKKRKASATRKLKVTKKTKAATKVGKKRKAKSEAKKKKATKKKAAKGFQLSRRSDNTFACDLNESEVEMSCPWMAQDEVLANSSAMLKKLMERHIDMVQMKGGDHGLLDMAKDNICTILRKNKAVAADAPPTVAAAAASPKLDSRELGDDEDGGEDGGEEPVSDIPSDLPFLLFQATAKYIDFLKQQNMEENVNLATRKYQKHWKSSFQVMTEGKAIGSATYKEAKLIHGTMVICLELKALMQPILSEIVYGFCKVGLCCYCWFVANTVCSKVEPWK